MIGARPQQAIRGTSSRSALFQIEAGRVTRFFSPMGSPANCASSVPHRRGRAVPAAHGGPKMRKINGQSGCSAAVQVATQKIVGRYPSFD